MSFSFSFRSLCISLLFNFYSLHSQSPEQIAADAMDSASASSWTYGGNFVIPTLSGCPYQDAECFTLKDDPSSPLENGFAEKTFDVSGYHDISFAINFITTNTSGQFRYIAYYDAANPTTKQTLLFMMSDPCCYSSKYPSLDPSPESLWDDTAYLKIRFEVKALDLSMNPTPATGILLSSFILSGVPYTDVPTINPTNNPSVFPTKNPTVNPTISPTFFPSETPTVSPSKSPSQGTDGPTNHPSSNPITSDPSSSPSRVPSNDPSVSPTDNPSNNPSNNPSGNPSVSPTDNPSYAPSMPSKAPSNALVAKSGVDMMNMVLSIIFIMNLQIFVL